MALSDSGWLYPLSYTCVCVCASIIHPPEDPYMHTYRKSSYSA